MTLSGLLYTPDIMKVLSSKDYGSDSAFIPIELLKALNLHIRGNDIFNQHMKVRLLYIIKSIFHTTDLSEIYKLLNAGIL